MLQHFPVVVSKRVLVEEPFMYSIMYPGLYPNVLLSVGNYSSQRAKEW